MAGKGRFCATVDGDSMYPFLWPSDLAVFQKSVTPQLGMIVLYRHNDMTATIKQLKHDGKRFLLHAINETYEDVEASGIAMGFLIGFDRHIGSKRQTSFDPDGLFP